MRDRGAGVDARPGQLTPPGPPADAYGCGDAFAAGLTFGLGAGLTVARAAAIGAERGAGCLTRRGPYDVP